MKEAVATAGNRSFQSQRNCSKMQNYLSGKYKILQTVTKFETLLPRYSPLLNR
jgi:hypothetical protein